MPYDLTYKWNLINKTSKENITTDIEIKNKTGSNQRGRRRWIVGVRRTRVIKEHV